LAEDGEGALHHLFLVAASLDSMVVGEAQILSQVKQAYDLANTCDSTGPLLHSVFQAAMRVARRVARETAINQKRVSIPSIAVSEFAKQLFERFDDKSVLILGAGEMGEETLRYLMNEGVQRILIANRHHERAAELAERLAGKTISWEDRCAQLAAVDLVIGTTGAPEPVVSFEQFRPIAHRRADRPLFMLDLAVPRDFEPAIGDLPGVYLYSLDDLQRTCDANRREREREWPKATSIVEDETSRFVADLNHRATAPTIQRLKAQADELKTEELTRLLNRLGTLDPHAREEISRSFDRLVNKILHPPMESLRDEATRGTPHGLLDALKRLFQIQD
jgi:glutamyl-tRNA reductase